MTDLLSPPMVLPEDVLLTPIAEYPDEVRHVLGGEDGDCALSRRHARETTRVIGAEGARFLELFREPRTIVHAVIEYSRKERLDPEATLDRIFPFVQELIGAGFLVTAGSVYEQKTAASHEVGSELAGYEVVRCIQLVEDTEVYQARTADGGAVALKLVRTGFEAALGPRLAHEAQVLRLLGGRAAPRLLELGEIEGRPFLATTWSHGLNALAAAEELRAQDDRAGLLRLLRGIAAAYAELHAAGVLHGDIHPRNVLVDRAGTVTLIDFGLALAPWQAAGIPSGIGPGFFSDPELARAWLEGRAPPGYDARAEQYSIGVVLYLLASGQEYLEFDLQRDRMLRQIAEVPPRSFEAVGQKAWPELEAVLARMLAKDAGDRYPDLAAAATALGVLPEQPAWAIGGGSDDQFVDELLAELEPRSNVFAAGLPCAPTCSVNIGAAGVAYALYRVAVARERPDLLALADLWIEKALAERSRPDAFTNAEMEVTPEVVGPISPYHAEPGLHLVRALTAQAVDDRETVRAALAAFHALSGHSWANRDLTLGRCGTVLGCVFLLEALRREGYPEVVELLALGAGRLDELWTELAEAGELHGDPLWPNLGVAHGWAGLLYATLRWAQAVPGGAADRRRAQARERLDQLVAAAWPLGRGLVIPWRDQAGSTDRSMPGWCNGSAGLVHLGCLAHATYGDSSYLEFAERAAWAAWEAEGAYVDLCCGLAGRAYALLELFRATGDADWRRRAESLATRAVRVAPAQRGDEHPRHSLYKGELGLAVLLSDLAMPEAASMPIFGRESLAL
jgi:serine/threonine-protein kinase